MYCDLYAAETSKRFCVGDRDHAAAQIAAGFGLVGFVHTVDAPTLLPDIDDLVASLRPTRQSICAFSAHCRRVNIVATESMDLPDLCARCQQYDLVSVEPRDERSLQLACGTHGVDIITLDISQQLPFVAKLSALKAAVARGVYVEVQLAGVMEGAEALRHGIANAQALVGRGLRASGFLLSSGRRSSASAPRSPEDYMAFALMLGFPHSLACAALSCNGLKVLAHAKARRQLPGGVAVTS